MHDYRMELLVWASCRGQLLARTVTGMMRNLKVRAGLQVSNTHLCTHSGDQRTRECESKRRLLLTRTAATGIVQLQ